METLTRPVDIAAPRRKRRDNPDRDNRLREIRRAQDKTQQQCADFLGMTPQAISQAEFRADSISLSKWRLLAQFLDVPLDQLVSR